MPNDNDTQPNVINVKSILSSDTWNNAFPFHNTVYSYESFLRAVAKFPMFCNESASATVTLEDTCKQELATLLAHISYESGSLQAVAQDSCSDPYNKTTACNYFSDDSITCLIWPPYAGV